MPTVIQREAILQRLVRVEALLEEGFRRIEEKLKNGEPAFQLFSDALAAQQERHKRDTSLGSRSRLWQRARFDKELGFPHRKILDVLVDRFDFEQSEFKEVTFSRLVAEARVGKSRARAYLEALEQRGYITKRDDGYRKFFRIQE